MKIFTTINNSRKKCIREYNVGDVVTDGVNYYLITNLYSWELNRIEIVYLNLFENTIYKRESISDKEDFVECNANLDIEHQSVTEKD